MIPNGLELLLGPMRSNKTDELMRRVVMRKEFARQDVLVIKPGDDTKSGVGMIESRNPVGRKQMNALEISSETPEDIWGVIEEQERLIGRKLGCVAIDEGQFFKGLFPTVGALLERGYETIVAGLDLDFRGLPFGDMLQLTWFVNAYGGSISWCIAYCTCGERAFFSQRLIDGEPAPYNSPIKVPGDSYEPRCRRHFVLPGRGANLRW